MNGERIEGRVLERDQARGIYEGIVRRMQDPGLLEFADHGLFQASIYPIPANGLQTVEIEYASVLEQAGTDALYRYPMHESMGNAIGSLSFNVTIAGRAPVQRVYSPHHRITTENDRSQNGVTRVAHESRGATTSDDFELYITEGGEDVGFSLLTWDADDGEPGYFMMTLSPSDELTNLEVLPKQVTFVVDTSGSMAGIKIDQARQMLHQTVGQLREDDTFNIIGFSTSVRPLFDEPARATRANLEQATRFIDRLSATGNTNISGALSRAFQDPAAADRPHVIIFVTDGLPTEGDTNIERIIAASGEGVAEGDRRVFAFGVGYDVNTRLLDGVSRTGRGRAAYVRPEENMSDVVGEFYAGIGDPLLTRLELDFGPVDVDQVYPRPLPDLYRGGQVTLFGRFEARSSGFVEVRGRAGRERIEMRFPADFGSGGDTDRSFIGNLWAARRVDGLLADIALNGENNDNVQEIIALGTEWNIVTPYTSYLTVEPSYALPEPEAARWEAEDPSPDTAWGGNAIGGTSSTGATTPTVDRTARPVDEELAANNVQTATTSRGQRPTSRSVPASAPRSSRDADDMAQQPRREAAAAPGGSGRSAVEGAIARSEAAEALVVTDDNRRERQSRNVGTRRFNQTSGVWVEAGLESRSVDEVVEAFSDRYFELLTLAPGMDDVFALGRVRFEWNGRVYEIR
jgi:Ca-activated chloride channel family protein